MASKSVGLEPACLGLNPSTTPSQLLHELGQVKLLSVRKALPLSVVMKIYELSYIKHTLKKITEKESKKSWKGEVDMPTTKTDCGSFSKNLVAYQGKTWSTVSFIILIWWKATQQFFKTGRFSSDAWGCAQLCLALCNPVDYSLSGSSVHGLFQVRILEWAAFFFSRGSS